MYKDLQKKDGKALFLHQCINGNILENLMHCENSKEAWNTVEMVYVGDDKLKNVILQELRRQYKLLATTDIESMSQYFGRLLNLTNQMRRNGETVTNLI